MTYCINPKCTNRENSEEAQICHGCGMALLICDRYLIPNPLCPIPDSPIPYALCPMPNPQLINLF